MQVETDRLVLRRPEEKDACAYAQIHNSEFVLRFNAMNPTTAERMAVKFRDPAYLEGTLFLEEKASGQLIGAIFWEEDGLRYGVESRDLSYFIAESHSRKGYMKEALRGLLPWLFEKESLECVSARVFAPNVASRALLRSLGFRENGIIPHCVKGYCGQVFDDVIHTLFREDLEGSLHL